jgi:uncharacterized protein (DUF362 family)
MGNKNHKPENSCLSRKEFLRKSGYFALGLSLTPLLASIGCSNETSEAQAAASDGAAGAVKPDPTIFIAKDDTPTNLTRKAVEALGGMKKFISTGDKVALVPNIGWARTPEQAANTHPDVVEALTRMCFDAGAKQVEMFCNTCNNAKVSYETSGIAKAAEDAGAYVHFLASDSDFREIEVPDAIWSKKAKVAKALLDADKFINVPIAKNHGLSKLTLIQKNLMGVVKDRGVLHRNIHKELVALSKVLPANLYLIDATRILLRNGPTGGSLDDVKKMDKVIAGTDPIAMEAYAATLFGIDPASIGFIQLGYEEGLGNIDWESCCAFV